MQSFLSGTLLLLCDSLAGAPGAQSQRQPLDIHGDVPEPECLSGNFWLLGTSVPLHLCSRCACGAGAGVWVTAAPHTSTTAARLHAGSAGHQAGASWGSAICKAGEGLGADFWPFPSCHTSCPPPTNLASNSFSAKGWLISSSLLLGSANADRPARCCPVTLPAFIPSCLASFQVN